MDVSEAKRLRALEEENAKLKTPLAEQMLDAAALRELLSKNGRARLRNPDQLRRSPVAPPTPSGVQNPETLAAAG